MSEVFNELATAVAGWIIVSVGLTGLLVLLAYLTPDKAQQWFSMFWRIVSRIPALYRAGQRRYTRFSLQSDLNRFAKRLQKHAPFIASRARIAWTDANATKEAFLQKDRVVLRLHRDEDDRNENLVHGAMLFVSTSLLFRVKRYLSEDQRSALNLFVTGKFLEDAHASVQDVFLERYLLPETSDPNSPLPRYFQSFEIAHGRGLFFEVLLQALELLGGKVFGERVTDELPAEVDDLILFMEEVAGRRQRERLDLTFRRRYANMAIVIVGMAEKVTEDGETWATYIRNQLLPRRVETVFIVGSRANRRVMDAVAAGVATAYQPLFRKHSEIRLWEGTQFSQYVIAIHLRSAGLFPVPVAPATIDLTSGSVSGKGQAPHAPNLRNGRALATVTAYRSEGFGFLAVDDGPTRVFFHKNQSYGMPDMGVLGARVECEFKASVDRPGFRATGVWFVRYHYAGSDAPAPTVQAEAVVDDDQQLDRGAGGDTTVAVGTVKSGAVTRFGHKGYGFIAIEGGPPNAFFRREDCEDPPEFIVSGTRVECILEETSDGGFKARGVRFVEAGA